MSSLPNRASDAGPESRKHCPSCGSSKWAILSDCMDCHSGPFCDRCPGVQLISHYDKAKMGMGAPTELQCADCARESQEYADIEPECGCYCVGDQADASDCDLHGLHRITTRVAVAQVPEWVNQEDTPCPF